MKRHGKNNPINILTSDSLNKAESKQTPAPHDQLAKLYATNRFAFEVERKRLIQSFIEKFPDPKTGEKLQKVQRELDRIFNGAGSEHNRFVMMQEIFREQINNDFIPALNALCGKPRRGGTKKPEANHSRLESRESSRPGCKQYLRLIKGRKD